MNILWIPNFLPFPTDNGGKVVIANRMKQVSKKHTIYLITESDEVDADTHEAIKGICADYRLIKPINRSKLYQLKWFITQSLNVGRYWNPGITAAVSDFLMKYKIDLINLDLPMVYVNLYPIRESIGTIPVIVNQHNIEFANVRSKVKANGVSLVMKVYAYIESSKLYRWEKRTYADPAICAHSFVSENDMALFCDSFHERSRTLFYSPIGTNMPSVQSECHTEGEKAIIFTASFDYPPNVHGALWFCGEVMPLIRKKVKNAKLYLVGRNPKPEVKALANSDIVVTGSVPSVLPYLEMADIFVVPIFFGGGVKTKLIEMGCYGKPVISSTSGCKGTIFKDGEDLLVRDDPKEFAEACVDALAHAEKYHAMCMNMRNKTIENYLWDSIGAQYCTFLESQIF